MEQHETSSGVLAVAENTTAAAHRRDHNHPPGEDSCHPHVVEVVHLGDRALAVCHDCREDTGFLLHHSADGVAVDHRQQTRVTNVALKPGTATLRSLGGVDGSHNGRLGTDRSA